jgi:FkbM family methyltransferase
MESISVNKNGLNFQVLEDDPQKIRFWKKLSGDDWEPQTFEVFNRFLDKNKSYLDIGAWIGPTVLYGAGLAKHVYAFEPDRVAFGKLIQNVAQNKELAQKITCLNLAVSTSRSKLKLYMKSSSGDSMSSLLERSEASEFYEVEALHINDVAKQHNLKEINFVKVDIEGGEYTLIPSMAGFLKDTGATLFLSMHLPFLSQELHRKTSKSMFGIKLPQIVVKANVFLKRKLITYKLLQSLSFYKHIYDVAGNELSLMEILKDKKYDGFYELIFTHEKWNK